MNHKTLIPPLLPELGTNLVPISNFRGLHRECYLLVILTVALELTGLRTRVAAAGAAGTRREIAAPRPGRRVESLLQTSRRRRVYLHAGDGDAALVGPRSQTVVHEVGVAVVVMMMVMVVIVAFLVVLESEARAFASLGALDIGPRAPMVEKFAGLGGRVAGLEVLHARRGAWTAAAKVRHLSSVLARV